MYLHTKHAENNIPVLRQLVRENPLGVLTTGFKSTKYPFLQVTHLPFILDIQDETSETELGVLRGHLARQNPHSKAMSEVLQEAKEKSGSPSATGPGVLEDEVLVLFTAEPQHYISAKFFAETKPASGKVVPTWNYAAVQAYGRAKVYYDTKDPSTSEFLGQAVRDLSDKCEGEIMGYTGKATGRPEPWSVDEAPENFINLLKKNIIGIEIEVTRLEGKFKMSQESPAGDVRGVADGLAAFGTERSCATSKLVQARNEVLLNK